MPVSSPPAAKTVNWEGSPVIAAAMRDALQDPAGSMRQIAFDWVRSSHDTNAAAMLRTLYEHEPDMAMRASILRALPATSDSQSRALVGSVLKNKQTPVLLLEAAVDAAQTIGGNDWNAEVIHWAENPPNDKIEVKLFQILGKNKLSQTAPLLGKKLAGPDPLLRQAAVAALNQIGGDAAIAQFLPGLADPSMDVRRQSIDSLGTLRAKAAVPQLIKLSTNSQLSTPAIQALTQMPDLAALDVFLEGLASKNASLRAQCKTAVSSVATAALPLIEAKLSSTNGLPDEAVAALRDVYKDSNAAKKGPIFEIKVKQIPVTEYQSFALARRGDARRGGQIFMDVNGVNCIRCHSINGQGALIGPDLTGISTKQDRAQIIESVLYPSKLILDGYQQVLFKMKDDDDYSGIIRTETADTVTVIDSLGATNILQKSAIKSRKISQISLMPEGLQTGLSLKDFSDLIGFLENPNSATQAAGADQPSDPTDFLNLPPLPIEVPAPTAASEPAKASEESQEPQEQGSLPPPRAQHPHHNERILPPTGSPGFRPPGPRRPPDSPPPLPPLPPPADPD